MNSNKSSLSIVVPVYNEEKRLGVTFAAIDKFLSRNLFEEIEIIFVNDGSKDKTKEIIERYKPNVPVRIVDYGVNRGKGYAVTQGMLVAKHAFALMTDADMSTPLDQMDKFVPFMNGGYEVLVGNRRIVGADLVKAQGWLRRNMGRCYTLLANLITGVAVSDFTCGFKVFSRGAREKIFSKTRVDRWSYDTEILYLANKFGFVIKEVPVRWINDEGTRVNLWRDTVTSLVDLFKIRFHKYD